VPRLTVIDGLDAGRTVELSDRPITIGHHPDRDLVLSDDRASRLHCTVLARDGKVFVRDENSTNGTFLNGEVVKEAVLHTGDCLLLGDTVVMYEDENEPPPEATGDESGGIPLEEGAVASPAGGVPKPTSAEPTWALSGDEPPPASPVQGTVIVLPGSPPRRAAGGTVIAESPPGRPAETPRPNGEGGRSPSAPPTGGTDALPANDAVSAVREAVQSARPLAEAKGVRIRLTCCPAAPVRGDLNEVYRLLAQLLFVCLERTPSPYPLSFDIVVEAAEGGGVQVRLGADPAAPVREAVRSASGEAPLSDLLRRVAETDSHLDVPPSSSAGTDVFTLRIG